MMTQAKQECNGCTFHWFLLLFDRIGPHLVEDQIRYPDESKTFCSLRESLQSSLLNARPISPSFDPTNILTVIEVSH